MDTHKNLSLLGYSNFIGEIERKNVFCLGGVSCALSINLLLIAIYLLFIRNSH